MESQPSNAAKQEKIETKTETGIAPSHTAAHRHSDDAHDAHDAGSALYNGRRESTRFSVSGPALFLSPTFLVVALSVAVVVLFHYIKNDPSKYGDLRFWYIASALWRDGISPYDQNNVINLWNQLFINDPYLPVLPPEHGAFVYPPNSIILLYPIASLSYNTFVLVWAIGQAVFLFLYAMLNWQILAQLMRYKTDLYPHFSANIDPKWRYLWGSLALSAWILTPTIVMMLHYGQTTIIPYFAIYLIFYDFLRNSRKIFQVKLSSIPVFVSVFGRYLLPWAFLLTVASSKPQQGALMTLPLLALLPWTFLLILVGVTGFSVLLFAYWGVLSSGYSSFSGIFEILYTIQKIYPTLSPNQEWSFGLEDVFHLGVAEQNITYPIAFFCSVAVGFFLWQKRHVLQQKKQQPKKIPKITTTIDNTDQIFLDTMSFIFLLYSSLAVAVAWIVPGHSYDWIGMTLPVAVWGVYSFDTLVCVYRRQWHEFRFYGQHHAEHAWRHMLILVGTTALAVHWTLYHFSRRLGVSNILRNHITSYQILVFLLCIFGLCAYEYRALRRVTTSDDK